jgi:hypothetical protein
MKSLSKLSMLLTIIMMIGMVLASCTKEGPAGLPGKDGKDGKDGEDGINGLDGTATCAVCHDNSQVNFAITRHWEMSQHAMGNTYLRNTAACAGCHTSQGFREIIMTGAANTEGTISNPNPPNCYTCHKIHEDYTIADWDLTTTTPVTLRISGDVVDHGKGNLCATCHQPRLPSPMPVVGGPDITFASAQVAMRWGPHYGTEGAIAAGKGGYEIGTGYTNSAHVNAVANSCVTCHVVDNFNEQAGGHMFNLSYGDPENPSVLTTGCVSCHSNPETLQTLMSTVKTQLDDLMAELKGKLVDIGIINPSNTPQPGTWTADQAGALLNYRLIYYDGSNGVHNFPYAKKLLENSIASLQ